MSVCQTPARPFNSVRHETAASELGSYNLNNDLVLLPELNYITTIPSYRSPTTTTSATTPAYMVRRKQIELKSRNASTIKQNGRVRCQSLLSMLDSAHQMVVQAPMAQRLSLLPLKKKQLSKIIRISSIRKEPPMPRIRNERKTISINCKNELSIQERQSEVSIASTLAPFSPLKSRLDLL